MKAGKIDGSARFESDVMKTPINPSIIYGTRVEKKICSAMHTQLTENLKTKNPHKAFTTTRLITTNLHIAIERESGT